MKSSFLEEHFRIIAPAWPLQNTVAVNPFWKQIDRPFDEVMEKMSYLGHHSMFMPLSYYLEKYKKGEIQDQDIAEAESCSETNGSVNSFDLKKFIQVSSDAQKKFEGCNCFGDFVDKHTGSAWRSFVTYEIAKYASAFFDEGQALARFPWRDLSFYEAWFAAQEFDRSFQKAGFEGFPDTIREFQQLNPKNAMGQIASRLGLTNEDLLALYIGRLSLLNVGWASQFSYHEWRADLGYQKKSIVQSIELVAVQMIVDYALAVNFEKSSPGIIDSWVKSFQTAALVNSDGPSPFELNRIWLSSLERSRQRQLADQIKPTKELPDLPKIQIAMCIDVRSETYRRAIESVSGEIETIGFAGFFGLPFEYKKIDEKYPGVRAPVLLKSGFVVDEEMTSGTPHRKIAATLARSYFRNLRKAPMSSFLFVELFSLPALSEMVLRFLNSIKFSRKSKLPKRFFDQTTRPSSNAVILPSESNMQLDAKISTAATVLTHMGIKSRFADLIVLAGHGSHNTNNAFVSASDCGACGGHAGDVNARFLADLLNSAEVRIGLKKQHIEIPSSTSFIAAIHETVTDELYLLNQAGIPDLGEEDRQFLLSAIKKAGNIAREERKFARSKSLDPSPWRRAKNWSEVRPEWALAGNSCFIVAPRRFTKHANLAGRSFLHDYDWHNDKNFETLELIMTAPMLVTNWINIQYYASTVAPQIYGAGNKTLHNLVNENGVVEGNGGDLRIGLPWQSINDGTNFVHEPIRLSVYIAAPTAEIEKIIAKHLSVRNLVVNEWLFIFQIDEETGKKRRRDKFGSYV
jgi:uncharacterized protein YbcC (UPF0753/DUF2309 family)